MEPELPTARTDGEARNLQNAHRHWGLWIFGLMMVVGIGALGRASGDEIPTVRFTDVTAEAGIRFTHVNGAYGDKLLPETMGGGVAFFDFDNNGSQDLLFINSSYWPDHIPSGQSLPLMALYRNDGRGHFSDATADPVWT